MLLVKHSSTVKSFLSTSTNQYEFEPVCISIPLNKFVTISFSYMSSVEVPQKLVNQSDKVVPRLSTKMVGGAYFKKFCVSQI